MRFLNGMVQGSCMTHITYLFCLISTLGLRIHMMTTLTSSFPISIVECQYGCNLLLSLAHQTPLLQSLPSLSHCILPSPLPFLPLFCPPPSKALIDTQTTSFGFVFWKPWNQFSAHHYLHICKRASNPNLVFFQL
jgi:hypothetical protein